MELDPASPAARLAAAQAQDQTLFRSLWSDPNVAVNALLTAPDDPTSYVNASRFQIAAQSRKELFGAVSYTTLEGGLVGCSDCARLSFQPVPKGTEAFLVVVEMGTGGRGRLFVDEL